MNEDIDLILDMAAESMEKAIVRLETELQKIRAGKATPSMLDSVRVDYYGSSTPLSQVANVNTLDGKTLSVQPWEKDQLENIEKGIQAANIGLNPQNNGELIIISIPPLTEERRRDLAKTAKAESENAKVSIRNARKEANDSIKELENDGLGEDAAKTAESRVQDLTNKYTARIDSLVEAKERDIMTV